VSPDGSICCEPSVDPAGLWQTEYDFDARSVLHIPRSWKPEWTEVFPGELAPIATVLEPVLQSWLEQSLPPEVVGFFDQLDATAAVASRAIVSGSLEVVPSGSGWSGRERWSALSLPEACDGAGLQIALDGGWDSGGPIEVIGETWSFERTRRVSPSTWSQRLLDEVAWCASAGAWTSVGELFDQGLDCEGIQGPIELEGVLHQACRALGVYWRERFRIPVVPSQTWTVSQKGRWTTDGQVLGGTDDGWVSTGTTAQPLFQWSAQRLPSEGEGS
jgi:hypothetical protein